MTSVHCELFPDCMEIGENAHVPVCFKQGCPGRAQRDFAEVFARAVTTLRSESMSDEENAIADMAGFLFAAGVSLGDAEFAAKQLHRQGFRIIRADLQAGSGQL
jgi:hypothetical protein